MSQALQAANEDEAAMLADLAELSRNPEAVEALLARLGYRVHAIGTGWFAPGSIGLPTLLFPLHIRTQLTIRQRHLSGRGVARACTIAAGLAMLRSVSLRPALLFMSETQTLPDGVEPTETISLQGGTVPRIWPGCFGRVDMLVRVTGRAAELGQPDTAINVIEAIVPALQALMQLKEDLQRRDHHRRQFRDAPLRPRLTVNALHGGHACAALPSLVDLIVSRRYDPAESLEAAIGEVREALREAIRPELSMDLSITDHQCPTSEPNAPFYGREQRALAVGWGWPQQPFCPSPPFIPGSVLFGGLERPDCDPGSIDAVTSMDDMAALARSLRALLLGE